MAIMEALKANKIIGNQNDGMAEFLFFQIRRVTKGFKFHAQPQTGAYSCYVLRLAFSANLAFVIIVYVQI